MSDKANIPLSESEEILLMKFFDGQCSFLERGKAQRLIEQSQSACEFMDSMRGCSESVRNVKAQSTKIDLWQEVSRRIEAEEHAALFLGKRDTHTRPSLGERISGFFGSTWNLGMSGAAVAAGLALFVILPAKTATAPGSEQMVELVRGVSLDTGDEDSPVRPVGSHGRPQIINEPSTNVVEVDWMRSDGRLRMLHQPSERSAVIWVKRRDPSARVRQGRRAAPVMLEQSTPLAYSISSK